MSELKLTNEQSEAINRRGKIIVSASAGSGKTFVMINRLVELIKGDLGMQEFLAVTFTNKAAAGMTEKLRKELIKAINAEEEQNKKRELKDKLSQICMADISTIHSFCSRLLRRYFYETGISDSFEIASEEDARGREIYEEALEDVIESGYEEGDEKLVLLLRVFRSRKSDDGVKEAVRYVYEKLRVQSDYREILLAGSRFTEEKFERICSELLKEYKAKAKEFSAYLDGIGVCDTDPKDVFAAKEYIDGELEKLLGAENLFSLRNIQPAPKPRKGTSKKIDDEAKLRRENISSLKESVFDFVSEIFSDALFADENTEKERYLASGAVLDALFAYALRFDDRYSALKAKRSVIDYNDLEHMAIKLLENEEVLKAVREKYRCIFVDEYQDVNPAQEKILSAISGEEVFLVGDKKQAIYSFRGGKAKYFSEKEREFKDGNLILSSNFRSAGKILRFVNEVFCDVMTAENSGIDYAAAPMKGGDFYGDKEGIVNIYPVSADKNSCGKPDGIYKLDEYADLLPDYSSPTACKVYSVIRSSVSEPMDGGADASKDAPWRYYDVESGEMKKVNYGDIAILVRSMTSTGVSDLINYLVSKGVPVTSLSKINICDYPEVRKIIDILKYIDNPEEDIPLCAALLSPIGKLNNDDLANIKLYSEGKKREEALPFRRETAEYAAEVQDPTADKLNAFFAESEKLRIRACILSAAQVINVILSEYGLEADVLSLDNGANCMARVNRLVSACGSDSTHEFLRKLRTMDYDIPFTENSGENSVKILTVHASKGLEYPVVIMPFLNASFHSEKKDETIYEDEFGFAPKYYDLEKMIKYKTVLRRYEEVHNERERVKDEMNLFYVALTRAKYALHLVMNEKKCESFGYNCYADFIPLALCEKYATDLPPVEESERAGTPVPDADGARDTEEFRQLERVFAKEYPHSASVNLAVKSNATNLVRIAAESKDAEYYRVENAFRPVAEKGTINPEVGTAYHAFLENADFSSPDGEYDRVLPLLSKEQAKLIDREKCRRILSLPIFARLKDGALYRERKFIVSFPASKYLDTDSSDEVIFQGAIDLLSIGKEGALIVDYKYSGRSAEDLKRHYMPQIRLYRDTVAKLMRISAETIGTVILNIFSGEEIAVDCDKNI